MNRRPPGCRRATRVALPLLVVLASVAGLPAKKREPTTPGEPTLAALTEGAETIDGLLTFYRTEDKLYLRLPAELVGAPLGFAAVRVHAGGDYAMRGGAIDNQLVRWRVVGDRLVLVKENLDFRAEHDPTTERLLESSFSDSPVFSAPLVRTNDEPAPLVIDASKLFGPDLAQLLPDDAGYDVRADDAILASLESFDDNVVARVVYRAHRQAKPAEQAANPFSRFVRPGRLPDARAAEITVDYNFYRLEDDGFRPRAADERIGGMTLSYKDYSDVDNADTLFRHVLRRFDLRKVDPSAAVSDPIEPITFYIDRSVPERWRPLVREATLWWNPAFEAVGLRNALRVLDAPDDPRWDPADIRHSVIFWNYSDDLVFSGVAGPIFVDPRNGKTIKATVHLNGEFFSYGLHRYLVYAWWRAPAPGADATTWQARRDAARALRRAPAACDRAASFSSQMAFARLVLRSRGVIGADPAEDDRFIREAFRELVAHEVGHALGFPHNWKASLVSRWEDVRRGSVEGRLGPRIFSASVMDYNPIYLAPRGTTQGDYFLTELGPYDYLTVDYVYRPLDQLASREQAVALDAIAARAETEPGLVYDSGLLGGIDPTTNSDDYGDDPLAFAASRLAMLRDEVLPRLPELVLAEGHDYNMLRQALDAAVFSVAMDYVDMTTRFVGGQILLRRVAGSAAAEPGGPPPITPVAAADQRRALDVLDEYLFDEAAFALPPETLALLKADLHEDWNYPWRYASDYDLGRRIAGLYDAALATLFEPARLTRVLDNERRVAAGGEVFTLPELFDRLRATAFGELGRQSAERRALQRLLVDRLSGLVLAPAAGTPVEASQLAASSLRAIRREVEAMLADARLDGYALAHFEDVALRAKRVLDASIRLPLPS